MNRHENPMILTKTPGAQFEVSIDGTPRTYRDRKVFAIEAAEHLNPQTSEQRHRGEGLTERQGDHDQVQTRFGVALTFTRESHGEPR
jgi:hypothetical protein